MLPIKCLSIFPSLIGLHVSPCFLNQKENINWFKKTQKPPWIQEVNWTYMRRYIHSIYVLVYASVRCGISEKRYENLFMTFWEAIICICPIKKWLWKILHNLWGSTCDGVLLHYVDDTEISIHWFFFLACCSSMLNCFLNLKFKFFLWFLYWCCWVELLQYST